MLGEEVAEGQSSKDLQWLGLCLAGTWSPAVLLRAQFQGQFYPMYLSLIWMQELNKSLASLLMIPNLEVVLTDPLERDLVRQSTCLLSVAPWQRRCRRRSWSLLPGIHWQDTWEWLKRALGEVQTGHWEAFLYQVVRHWTGLLERWLMPQACLRGIWTSCSALKWMEAFQGVDDHCRSLSTEISVLFSYSSIFTAVVSRLNAVLSIHNRTCQLWCYLGFFHAAHHFLKRQ